MPDSPGLETLFVRSYFDRHIMTRLAVDLRGHGFDVFTTEEARKDTATDEEQLAFATSQLRAILTFNIRDFALIHRQWQAAGRTHSRHHRVPTTREPPLRPSPHADASPS